MIESLAISMNLTAPVLNLKDVGFHYAGSGVDTPVLHKLNMTVNRGEMVAVQGPSGSGKSTLFYLIGCMLKPASGQIVFNGRDLSLLSDFELAQFRNRHIGFVFQQFHLLPRASVLQNIMLPSQYPAELPSTEVADRSRAISIATRLGLGEHLQKQPQQLSGGQQQRVAIARALLRDVDLILADEPTGNLDSRNATEVLELFEELNRQGRTIVLITHDDNVAKRCHRIFHFRDGQIQSTQVSKLEPPSLTKAVTSSINFERSALEASYLRSTLASLPVVFANISRNRTKSLLTMLGVIIGVASVLAMLSLGQFTKRRVLEGYESLGVNKLQLYGHRNWRLNAGAQINPNPFQGFKWHTDLLPLMEVFPEITRMSPIASSWGVRISYGGKIVSSETQLMGVNEQYLAISNGRMEHGYFLSAANVDRGDKVCTLGAGLPKALNQPAADLVGKFVMIVLNERLTVPCLVIGILRSQRSNKEWQNPDLQVLLPFTTHSAVSNPYEKRIQNVVATISFKASVEDSGRKITNFFKSRYGDSGEFQVDTDSVMIAQMKRFLNVFSILLAAVAFLSLTVGGIGIHNMMLVSVADRLKEIGLRKAVGATSRSLRILFLSESVVLCVIAGLVGIVLGIGCCQLGIFTATKLVKGLTYEWVFEPFALGVSVIAMLTVGTLSGLAPARKAELLTVIEALRSE